jgi:hypothetical protein
MLRPDPYSLLKNAQKSYIGSTVNRLHFTLQACRRIHLTLPISRPNEAQRNKGRLDGLAALRQYQAGD